MGMLIDLTKDDTGFRVPLEDCYLRITNAVPDLGNKSAKILISVFLSKASRDNGGGALPINATLDLEIKEEKQEKRLVVPRDQNGNVLFNATVHGKPACVPQEFPEIPPFADILGQIVAALGQGAEKYKDVGYWLVKSLPFVLERNPRDVFEEAQPG